MPPTLYRVRASSKHGELSLNKVWTQEGKTPFASGYKQLVSFTTGGTSYLLAVDPKGAGKLFRASASAPYFSPVRAKINVGSNVDIVEPFILGLQPYLLAYGAKAGVFAIYPLDASFNTKPPYTHSHPRPPATIGFTMAMPVVVNGLVFVLCYNSATGDVAAYSLSVTATPAPGSAPDTPPLVMSNVWSNQWAKQWTRFAFFRMGGENFFFKTNVGKLNVNIDHLLDVPSMGTIEVGTELHLPEALDINIVEPFTRGGGEPYFLTYIAKSGKTTLNRFHADCQGWTQEASLKTMPEATLITPYIVEKENFVLFY